MRRTTIALGLVSVALALIGLAMVGMAQTPAEDAEYVGASACEGCHGEQYDAWETTHHARPFGMNYSSSYYNKLTGAHNESENANITMVKYCAECHVVGWQNASGNGFNDALPWNDTTGTPGNDELIGIQCENCHGPGSEHLAAPFADKADYINLLYSPNAESCGANGISGCHFEARQWGTDEISGWNDSAHASGVPVYAKREPCSHCMSTEGAIAMFEAGAVSGEISYEDAGDFVSDENTDFRITCAACHDPHPDADNENHAQLRVSEEDICASCHRSSHEYPAVGVHHGTGNFFEGEGVGVDYIPYMEDVTCVDCHMGYQTGRGTPDYNTPNHTLKHTFEPNAESCMECHSMYETAEDAWEYVDDVQARNAPLLLEVEELMEEAEMAMIWLQEMDMWPVDMTGLNKTWYDSGWNLGLAESEGSGGFHNPPYWTALLENAAMGYEEIIMAAEIGKVTGTMVDGDGVAISGAVIETGMGTALATTNATGAFMFMAPEGTHNLIVMDGAVALGAIPDVVVVFNTTTALGELAFGAATPEDCPACNCTDDNTTTCDDDTTTDDGEETPSVGAFAVLGVIGIVATVFRVRKD